MIGSTSFRYDSAGLRHLRLDTDAGPSQANQALGSQKSEKKIHPHRKSYRTFIWDGTPELRLLGNERTFNPSIASVKGQSANNHL